MSAAAACEEVWGGNQGAAPRVNDAITILKILLEGLQSGDSAGLLLQAAKAVAAVPGGCGPEHRII